ncbi:hypothetical protein LTR37_006112 [Vermiconidia calcicola]|uniref:Uncharacterized protein n=1 Tax=Vermiconidia calcicola TaxID=1690605 RepID=A0ACC3NKE1_9PEZI|nr:hypothetical protein LTR37_006112 [Vermiconidia calcicola]
MAQQGTKRAHADSSTMGDGGGSPPAQSTRRSGSGRECKQRGIKKLEREKRLRPLPGAESSEPIVIPDDEETVPTPPTSDQSTSATAAATSAELHDLRRSNAVLQQHQAQLKELGGLVEKTRSQQIEMQMRSDPGVSVVIPDLPAWPGSMTEAEYFDYRLDAGPVEVQREEAFKERARVRRAAEDAPITEKCNDVIDSYKKALKSMDDKLKAKDTEYSRKLAAKNDEIKGLHKQIREARDEIKALKKGGKGEGGKGRRG